MNTEGARRRYWHRSGLALLLLPLLMITIRLGLAASTTAAAVTDDQGWIATRHGPAGKDLNAIHFSDDKNGWIAGNNGRALYTRDGGRTWDRSTIATADNISDVYFHSKQDGYLLAGDRIFYTTDGGGEWRETRPVLQADFVVARDAQPDLYSVRFVNKKKGWVVGSINRRNEVIDSLVLHTSDGGLSWEQQLVPARDELIHLDFVDDENGWVVGASGAIFRTQDGGRTWTPQRSNTSMTLYHVDFRNQQSGWAVGEQGTILRTDNGGETWRPVRAVVRVTLLSVKFGSDSDGWVVGRSGVILRSSDGGRTWMRQESTTKQNLYALFVDKNKCWAAGGDGMVLRYER